MIVRPEQPTDDTTVDNVGLMFDNKFLFQFSIFICADTVAVLLQFTVKPPNKFCFFLYFDIVLIDYSTIYRVVRVR